MPNIEVKVEILQETDKAIRVENLNDKSVWIPKSQFEYENSNTTKIDLYNSGIKTILMPEWLAIEKELI